MNAFLFDVDGVLNDIASEPMVIKPEMFAHIVAVLQKGEPVGLISGRTVAAQLLYVVTPIEKYIEQDPLLEKSIIDNLFVSGEFGVTSVVHEQTNRKLQIDSELALSLTLMEELREASKEFKDYTFPILDKENVFSIVSNYGLKRKIFQDVKVRIIKRFREIVGDTPNIEISHDRTAVNVKHKKANKGLATSHYLKWLSDKAMEPEMFYVFGDSLSDLEMGEELHQRNLPFTYIFVGDKEDVDNKTFNFPLTITRERNDDGTLEYLDTIL